VSNRPPRFAPQGAKVALQSSTGRSGFPMARRPLFRRTAGGTCFLRAVRFDLATNYTHPMSVAPVFAIPRRADEPMDTGMDGRDIVTLACTAPIIAILVGLIGLHAFQRRTTLT
jgi:hypothetical protein